MIRLPRSVEEKKEILEYAKKYGQPTAKKRFCVSSYSLRNWSKKFDIKIPPVRSPYDDIRKKEVVEMVLIHGISHVIYLTGLDTKTIKSWFEHFGVKIPKPKTSYRYWEMIPSSVKKNREEFKK